MGNSLIDPQTYYVLNLIVFGNSGAIVSVPVFKNCQDISQPGHFAGQSGIRKGRIPEGTAVIGYPLFLGFLARDVLDEFPGRFRLFLQRYPR